MHTFLICHLSIFRNDLQNVAITNYIQTDEIFDIFEKLEFCIPNISQKLSFKKYVIFSHLCNEKDIFSRFNI